MKEFCQRRSVFLSLPVYLSQKSNMEFHYPEAIIGFKIMMYVFETYLNVRQYAAQKLTKPPKPLAGVVSQEDFENSQAYRQDISRLDFVDKFVNIVLDSGFLYFRMLSWLWKKSGDIVLYVGLNPENEICHTLAFLGGYSIWDQISWFPFSLYKKFVIQARYGFFKQTAWSYCKEIFNSIAHTIFFGVPLVAATIVISLKGGSSLVVCVWGSIFLISTASVFIYPVLAPHDDKFTPLPQGNLREKMEKLAVSMNCSLPKLFVVDKSTWSTRRNAFMCGFFNNKFILFCDSLLRQGNDRKVLAVLAHELGHSKFNHNMYYFIMVQIIIALEFGGYVLIRNSKALFESCGFHDAQPVFIRLMITRITLNNCLVHIVRFALNLVRRCFEFQADAYAKKHGFAKELQAAIILQEYCLVYPDPLYSAYYCNHPTMVERLVALEQSYKKAA